MGENAARNQFSFAGAHRPSAWPHGEQELLVPHGLGGVVAGDGALRDLPRL